MAKIEHHKGKNKPPKPVTPAGPVLVEEENEPLEVDGIEPSEEIAPSDPPESTEAATEAAIKVPFEEDPRKKPRAATLPADEFFAFGKQYPTPADLVWYIYRLFPVIRVMQSPKRSPKDRDLTHIQKIVGRSIDRDEILNTWGSGSYHIRMTDQSTPRTMTRQVCQCKLAIDEWTSRAPVFNDFSELVECDANKNFIDRLMREQVIKRSPEGRFVPYTATETPQPNGTDQSTMLKQTVDLAKDLAKTMSPKENSGFTGKDILDLPGKIMESAKSIVAISKPPEQDNSFLNLLLAQMTAEREERAAARDREREESAAARDREREEAKSARADAAAARQRELETLQKMMEKANTPPPPPPDPEAQLTKTFDILTKAKEFFGDGGATSRMNGWQEFLKEPVTALIDCIKPFAQVGASIVQAKAMVSVQEAIAKNPKLANQQQPQTAVTPTQHPDPGQSQPQTTTPPAQKTQQPMPPAPDPVLVILNAALMHVDFTLRSYFANEMNGAEFAGWFCDTEIPLPAPYNLMQESVIGAEALKKLQAFTATDPQGNKLEAPEAGKQLLVAAYRANPAIWAKIVTSPDKEPKFLKFLDEFLAYNPEGEPAPPAKGAKHP